MKKNENTIITIITFAFGFRYTCHRSLPTGSVFQMEHGRGVISGMLAQKLAQSFSNIQNIFQANDNFFLVLRILRHSEGINELSEKIEAVEVGITDDIELLSGQGVTLVIGFIRDHPYGATKNGVNVVQFAVLLLGDAF